MEVTGPLAGCRARLAASAVLVLLTAGSATAHHSVLGQFDISRTVSLTGTIARVDWINPHPYVYLETRAANGTVTTWALSAAPIAMLRRTGVTKESLAGRSGETVSVIAYPALNGRPLGWITRITYADGHYFLLSPA